MIKVYLNSVREAAPPDRNGARSFVIGERETEVYSGDKAGAVEFLKGIGVGHSVAVRYPGGLRSCMNKPALWDWITSL